ncbi:MAG: hypothetical protein WCQ41_06520 [Bacillota bacterium]
MKRFISVIFILVFALSFTMGVTSSAAKVVKKSPTPTTTVASVSSSLINGDFSSSKDGKVPDGWEANLYNNEGKITYFPAKDGNKAYVEISNSVPTDSRIKQKVALSPNTTYEFSCEIKANIPEKKGAGAIVSVYGKNESSAGIFSSDWKKASLYIITGKEINSGYELTLGVGGYANISSGSAFFRSAKLKVFTGKLPNNASTIDLSGRDPSQDTSGKSDTNVPATQSNIMWIIIIVAIVLVGGISYYLFVMRKSASTSPEDEELEEESVETFEDNVDQTPKKDTKNDEEDLL